MLLWKKVIFSIEKAFLGQGITSAFVLLALEFSFYKNIFLIFLHVQGENAYELWEFILNWELCIFS